MDDEIPAWVLMLEPTAEGWEVCGHNHWRARMPASAHFDWLYVVSDAEQTAYFRQTVNDEFRERMEHAEAYIWAKLERKVEAFLQEHANAR